MHSSSWSAAEVNSHFPSQWRLLNEIILKVGNDTKLVILRVHFSSLSSELVVYFFLRFDLPHSHSPTILMLSILQARSIFNSTVIRRATHRRIGFLGIPTKNL